MTLKTMAGSASDDDRNDGGRRGKDGSKDASLMSASHVWCGGLEGREQEAVEGGQEEQEQT